MTPIAIQTFNRPDYLERTLKSLEKSGTLSQCSNIHVFDCGSSSEALAYVENLCLSYDLELHKSDSGRLSLREGVLKIDMVLGEDFLRMEDDVLVCKNWYPYSVFIMNALEGWEVINFYSLDAHNLVRPTNISNIYRKGSVTHYGICLVAFRHGDVIERINKCAIETSEPFDIAISLECGWYEDGQEKLGTGTGTLCVHTPSIVQHFGKESKEEAPFHEAKDFVGEDFNSLRLLEV